VLDLQGNVLQPLCHFFFISILSKPCSVLQLLWFILFLGTRISFNHFFYGQQAAIPMCILRESVREMRRFLLCCLRNALGLALSRHLWKVLGFILLFWCSIWRYGWGCSQVHYFLLVLMLRVNSCRNHFVVLRLKLWYFRQASWRLRWSFLTVDSVVSFEMDTRGGI